MPGRSEGPDQLEVGMQWFSWALLMTVVSLCQAGAVILGMEFWRAGGLLEALFPWAVALLFAVPWLGLTSFGLKAEKLGAVLRLDERGLQHCLLPLFPWNHVNAVVIRETVIKRTHHDNLEVRHIPRINRELVVALDETMIPTLEACVRVRRLNWSAPKVELGSRCIVIGFTMMGAEPFDLVKAVRRVGQYHRPDWTFEA